MDRCAKEYPDGQASTNRRAETIATLSISVLPGRRRGEL
jgi:hypothetical protein